MGAKNTQKTKTRYFSGNTKDEGFTFIEILVSVFIFSLIGGATLNILISAIAVQQTSLAKQALVDQTSFTIEYMSRAIREAQKPPESECITRNTNYEIIGTDRLKFVDISGRCRDIFFDNSGGFGTVKEDIDGLGAVELFSDELEVHSLVFTLTGEKQTDNLQPRVTFYLDVGARGGNQGTRPRMQLQTSISQRNIDVQI